MMRNGAPIGVLALMRTEVRPFNAKQIELVQTFADQAVIAIENARLFDEVRARTRDLEESLRQQTATADVLKVISRSAFDLDAVFDALLTSAVSLIGSRGGTICVREGDAFKYRAVAEGQGLGDVAVSFRKSPRPGAGVRGGSNLALRQARNHHRHAFGQRPQRSGARARGLPLRRRRTLAAQRQS